MNNLIVRSAVYGALGNNDPKNSSAADVSAALQAQIIANHGLVNITNQTMGGDPCYGFQKSFAAVVNRDGIDRFFACHEGQSIDFNYGN